MGLMVKDTRILVVGPPKSWLRVPQKVMPRNPDKLAHANCGEAGRFVRQNAQDICCYNPHCNTLSML